MTRRRLGVALLVPEPQRSAVDALRLAVADRALARIPAHLTLVPPVNVREERLPDVLALLRDAAATGPPLALTLGPPRTFLPDNPVLYLGVSGDLDGLRALRDAVFTGPLHRTLSWPFVPHVTLADEAAPAHIEAALVALAGFRVEVTFARLHLLQEGPDRRWEPIADADLAGRAVIGRGGLELELTRSARPEPDAGSGTGRPFDITARREGKVVGWVRGAIEGDRARLTELAVTEAVRGQGIGSHLAAAAEALALEEGCRTVSVVVGATGRGPSFYEGRGWTVAARQEVIELRRVLPTPTLR